MGNNASTIHDQIFELKFASKSMAREAKKSEKQMRKQRIAVKKALKEGNRDIAQVHAENAVRENKQSLTYLTLSARLDAASSRMKSMSAQQTLTKQISGLSKAMDSAMKSMDLEQMTSIMDTFEAQSESLDVRTSVVKDSLASAAVKSGQDEVSAFLDAIQDEIAAEIPSAPIGMQQQEETKEQVDDEVERRINALASI